MIDIQLWRQRHKICDEWKEFEPFYDWAISNGYRDGLSIDRKNSDGNYEPSNCRWVTVKVQANNTSQNQLLLFNGCLKTIAEWCDELKLPYSAVYQRIKILKWDVSRALTTPVCYMEGKRRGII